MKTRTIMIPYKFRKWDLSKLGKENHSNSRINVIRTETNEILI